MSRQSISLRSHCNSRFLFIKDLLLFISSGVQSVRYKLGQKDKQNVTHRIFLLGQLCRLSCCLFCPLRQKNRKKMSIARWSELPNCDSVFSKHARAYSAHPLNPYPQRLKTFSTAVQFSIKFPLFFPPPTSTHFHTEITSYATVVTMMSSPVTISCFRAKAHLVFHIRK